MDFRDNLFIWSIMKVSNMNQVGRFHEEWSDLLGLLRRKPTQSRHGKQGPTKHIWASPGKPGGMWWRYVEIFVFAPPKKELIILVY